MGSLARLKLLLKGRQRRRQGYERMLYIEILLAYVESGYEFGFAAHQASERMASVTREPPVQPTDLEKLFRSWEGLGDCGTESLRVIAELYAAGMPLHSALKQLATSLRRSQRDEWEAFSTGLSPRLNAVLLLFFLPPALLLLLAPICLALLRLR